MDSVTIPTFRFPCNELRRNELRQGTVFEAHPIKHRVTLPPASSISISNTFYDNLRTLSIVTSAGNRR
jgi:hypothetical protein